MKALIKKIWPATKKDITGLRKLSQENLWANVYHDTTKSSKWLKEKNMSPGRMAVGYQGMYVLYRILDDTSPKNILELGLGETTKMIDQYLELEHGESHIVVEENLEWIAVFEGKYKKLKKSKVLHKAASLKTYKSKSKVRMYDCFENEIADIKFNLIIVDGPTSGDMTDFARIDILKLIPQILAEDFIIFVDDTDRKPEENTVKEIKKILTKNKIEFSMGEYDSIRKTTVITSLSYKFICSL